MIKKIGKDGRPASAGRGEETMADERDTLEASAVTQEQQHGKGKQVDSLPPHDGEPEAAAETVVEPIGERVAKDRATSVVLAYRSVDWDQVVEGDPEAVAALVSACDQHESARIYLESLQGDAEGGQTPELMELAARLAEGLEKFYAEHVASKLRHQKVIRQMLAVAEAPTMTGQDEPATLEEGLAPRKRPSVTVGHTMRVNTGCGNLYVTVNEDEAGRPFELFNHMGKAGGCAASQNEAIGRLISYALRCGASIEPLIKQLKGISCHRPAWSEEGKISSCADGIGKALERYWVAQERRKEAEAAAASAAPSAVEADAPASLRSQRAELSAALTPTAPAPAPSRAPPRKPGPGDHNKVQGACRDCGSQLAYEEGCVKCYSCGFTECG